MPRLRRGSPLIISVHGIAMETLLRAIEMSDSSTLRINPSLAAQNRVYVGVCWISFCVCDPMHVSWNKIPWRICFFHLSQG